MKKNKIVMIVLLLLISCLGMIAFAGCGIISGNIISKPPIINVDNIKDQAISSVVANNACSSVVKVYCVWGANKSAGAGFVMNENGYVVTNAHCILKENSKVFDSKAKISVEFWDGTVVAMANVGFDPELDIAILKPKAVAKDFDFLKFGDSSKVVFGQQAYTFGNPENIALMFSSAMVSNPSVQLNPTVPQTSILLDSTINHGNSGGALINNKTEVIGVVFARLESEDSAVNKLYGVGCAIPSNDIMAYIDKEIKVLDSKAVYTKAA